MRERLCMLGLPGSGKTSFLAALFELVSHADVHGAPKLVALPEDRTYLQTVHERWLRCEPALRTKDRGDPASVRFDLAIDETEPRSITVPDVAGGAVLTLWEERRWTNGLDELAASASQILLFLRVDDIVPPRRVQLVMGPENAPMRPPEHGETQDRELPDSDFDAQIAPTQVKLVDLLQSVIAINPNRPLRLAVVLSAWDRVEDQGVAPLELVRLRLPLLWQFLTTNPEQFIFKTFGVSAQGGDFANRADAQRLLRIDPPSLRMLVIDGEQRSHDLSLPLRWLWTNS